MIDAGLDNPICRPVAYFEQQLEQGFGETGAAQGHDGAYRFNIYVNPRSGSFTILIVLPTGIACLLVTGEDFQPIQPKPASSETPPERSP